jgi:hypothetical protein
MADDKPTPRSTIVDRFFLVFLAATALVAAYRAIPGIVVSQELASTGQLLWSWQGAALILAGVAFIYYGSRVAMSADETPRSVWVPLVLSGLIMVLVFPTIFTPGSTMSAPQGALAPTEVRGHLRDFAFLLFGLLLGFFFGNVTRQRQPKPPAA